jgi:hypothetical protein
MFASKDTLLTRPSGYTIARSVRLRSSASAYFNRTPASAGNQQKFTWSGWLKRGSLGTLMQLFSVGTTSPVTNFAFYLNASGGGGSAVDALEIYSQAATVANGYYTSQQVLRDPSAWYHIVLSVDTTQATAGNRVIIWVNNQLVTLTGVTVFSQNTNTVVNSVTTHRLAASAANNQTVDGYLTEINFIDGQALTPSSFGETDSITGVWKAKKYGGTYGTNGFYLNFSDNSSNTATTIGKDYSGNGNNWTPNNVQTYDSVPDTPSNNFCVMNPLYNGNSGTAWLDGNLKVNVSSSQSGITAATFGISSGKWYWEIVASPSSPPSLCVGIIKTSFTPIGDVFVGYQPEGYGYYSYDGRKVNNSSFSTYGSSWEGAQYVIGIALDMDAGTITFYRNNVSQGTAFSSLSGTFTFAASDGAISGTTFYVNFGADSSFAGQKTAQTNTDANGLGNFFYAVPSGYLALCTQNLPASTIKNGAAYMAATTYTGTGSAQNITNSGSFQPDFVWIKNRGGAYGHGLVDSVRGRASVLYSNDTAAQGTSGSTQDVTAFNSNGFALGTNSQIECNASGQSYIGWQWKAGGTSSSNTNGSITSTVSVGATQGFSVVTYTATNAAGTIGHGLGVAPSLIITKNRSDARNWGVYHTSIGATKFLQLNSTGASQTGTAWNDTAPTSSVFSVGGGSFGETNFPSGSTYVAYCFAAVAGYSSAFSYTGNGSSDGPFVYLGFRTRWVMVKNTTTAGGGWEIFDTSTGTTNPLGSTALFANLSDAEQGFGPEMDILSNGIKIRRATATRINSSGDTFIGFAFAESPFKTSLAR